MPDIEALYREHRAGLVRLVERELRDRHDAEDVVQTAFLEAQRAMERGTIPRHPRAWLAAIALNAARGLRHRQVSFDALEDYAVQEASRLPEIKAALTGLPKSEQAAVVYRDVLGLSYAEMAAQMGATVPAVTMLLHRGRTRLRKVLGIALPGACARPWRWLSGSPGQAAAAKTVGAVVVAGGLVSGGVFTAQHAARATAPATVTTAAQQPPRNFSGNAMKIDFRHGRARRGRHDRETLRARIGPSTAGHTATEVASGLPVLPKTGTGPNLTGGVSRPLAGKPRLSLPALTLPTATLPSTVATIETPVITATVAVPTGAGLTVPTPIATVTVNIP